MTRKVIADEFIQYMINQAKDCKEIKEQARKTAKFMSAQIKAPNLPTILELRKALTNGRLESLFNGVAVTMLTLNTLGEEIEKKMDKKDAEKLKRKVAKTFTPLQRALKESQEREERGADIYE
jgi:Zn-dependent M32 family carboxypeptidase